MTRLGQFCLLCIFVIAPVPMSYSLDLEGEDSYKVNDDFLWYEVSHPLISYEFSDIESALGQDFKPMHSLLGRNGAYVAKLHIRNNLQERRSWHILFNANFIDKGVAYWQPNLGSPQNLADFSQLSDNKTPQILHYQATFLSLGPLEEGELWFYVEAEHFAYPLSFQVLSDAQFYRKQLLINTVSVSSIATMLVLALLAFILFLRTGYGLSIACAGYVGLHGLGWAAASGLIDDFFNLTTINTTYAGMLIFPFAIACAVYFTRMLFNIDVKSAKLSFVLTFFGWGSLLLGVALPWVDFKVAFIASHILAVFWIPVTLYTGIYMLTKSDFRAKYYLLGNSLYAASLVFYMLAHLTAHPEDIYPELFVISALSFDCICILLSLSEWLKIKQTEYSRSYLQARYDPLTKVGNRFAFNEAVKKINKEIIISFIDLDGMKGINDKLGHEKGDDFLCECAMLMSRHLKNKGQVFRAGGDEFIWLFERSVFAKNANYHSEIKNIVAAIEDQLKKSGWRDIGLSIGMASTEEVATISACLALADARMYENKRHKSE